MLMSSSFYPPRVTSTISSVHSSSEVVSNQLIVCPLVPVSEGLAANLSRSKAPPRVKTPWSKLKEKYSVFYRGSGDTLSSIALEIAGDNPMTPLAFNILRSSLS
jgi:hypothetical protein